MHGPDLTSNAANDTNISTTTNRYFVVLPEDAFEEGIAYLRAQGFDVFVADAPERGVPREDEVGAATGIGMPALSVAFVEGSAEQISRLQDAAGGSGPILFVEPEKVRHLLPVSPSPSEGPVELEHSGGSFDTNNDDAILDETPFTWGLQATGVTGSKYSGAGVRVAILDTGIAFEKEPNGNIQYHPDFADRTIVTRSFVRGIPTAKDGNGHGTHCIGTACGSRQPVVPPRYGIACDAEIYVGKIVTDAGLGVDLWAISTP